MARTCRSRGVGSAVWSVSGVSMADSSAQRGIERKPRVDAARVVELAERANSVGGLAHERAEHAGLGCGLGLLVTLAHERFGDLLDERLLRRILDDREFLADLGLGGRERDGLVETADLVDEP